MAFWVYILRCADGAYYAGHTDDLTRRIAEHGSGAIPGYTSTWHPLKLVFSQELPSREEALAAEMQIKRRSRRKKEALIAGDWSGLRSAARKDFDLE